jgi:hypothetical protein
MTSLTAEELAIWAIIAFATIAVIVLVWRGDDGPPNVESR